MLSAADLLAVLLTAAGCTIGVTLLALLVLRLIRRASIGAQIAVVVVAVVLSITLSTAAIAAEMYFADHDLQLVVWVGAIAAALSLGAAWLLSRTARASARTLRESARRLGDGGIVDAQPVAWREFAEVSAQLADASERLAAARTEIERLDASRREFFAWISHDLRTPLAGMRALAEALEAGVVDDPTDYLRRIRAQVETMSRLVDELFELSKLQSGMVRLRCEHVDLLDVVSDAAAEVQQAAAERGVTITHAGVAAHVLWADPHELSRVVTNLLANAIRYAPPGSEILVSAHRTDDEHLVLSVLDHGSGVATEDLGRMFDVGWRGDAARTAGEPRGAGTAPGAGLGLAIVRGIVEAHGGDVHAEHVDGGFRLNVVLPMV